MTNKELAMCNHETKCENCIRLKGKIHFLEAKIALVNRIVSPLPEDYKPTFKDPMFKQDKE